MNNSLEALCTRIKNYAGLTRKQPIQDVFDKLVMTGHFDASMQNYGDDAAAIPFKDGYLLLAADGIMTGLLLNEPYAAGKASIMVTVNDIYSMGGRPMALVNVLASGDEQQRAQIVEGIRKGCDKLQVPMVGGHLHPDVPTDAPHLSVAILGWAEKVIYGYTAQAGDDLICAVDLIGRAGCKSVVSWDANSGKTSEELLFRLETLPIIAEREWASSAKDVSNAGLIGTLAIMMENSGLGARINLDAVPVPQGLNLPDWLLCFQSFGFVLAVPPQHTDKVLALFNERKIAAAVLGQAEPDRRVTVQQGAESILLFDFEKEVITGIAPMPRLP